MDYSKKALFKVKVGVYQGSVLCLLLSAIFMDAYTNHLNKEIKEFVYAVDLQFCEKAQKMSAKNMPDGKI